MKVTDVWEKSQSPTISFELFPAKTEKGAASLEVTIDTLATLKPDFVSVTFGAGGSTREGSRQLLKKLIEEDYNPSFSRTRAFLRCVPSRYGSLFMLSDNRLRSRKKVGREPLNKNTIEDASQGISHKIN